MLLRGRFVINGSNRLRSPAGRSSCECPPEGPEANGRRSPWKSGRACPSACWIWEKNSRSVFAFWDAIWRTARSSHSVVGSRPSWFQRCKQLPVGAAVLRLLLVEPSTPNSLVGFWQPRMLSAFSKPKQKMSESRLRCSCSVQRRWNIVKFPRVAEKDTSTSRSDGCQFLDSTLGSSKKRILGAPIPNPESTNMEVALRQ